MPKPTKARAASQKFHKAEQDSWDQLDQRREQREVDGLKLEVAALQKELDELKSTLNDAKGRSAEGEDARTIKGLNQELEREFRLRQHAASELREASAERDQLRAQLLAIQQTVQTDERVKEQARQLKEASVRETEIASKLGAVEEECAVYRQRIQQLEKSASVVEGKEEQRQKEVEERCEKIQARLASVEAEGEALEKQKEAIEIKVNLVEKENARLASTSEELNKELVAARANLISREGAAKAQASADRARHDLEQQLKTSRTRLEQLEKENSRLIEKVDIRSQEKISLEGKTSKLEEELKAAQAQLSASAKAHQKALDAANQQGLETKKTLSAIIARFHLSSADIDSLCSYNSAIDALLGGHNVLQLLQNTSNSYATALKEIDQLKDDVEVLEADLVAARKSTRRIANDVMTPPSSPEQIKTRELKAELETKLQATERRARTAEKEREVARAEVTELKSLLTKSEAALKERSAPATEAKSPDVPNPRAQVFIAQLKKDIMRLNGQVIELRKDNSELLLQMAGVGI